MPTSTEIAMSWKLSPTAWQLLASMVRGWTLRRHGPTYQDVYRQDGIDTRVRAATVHRLVELGAISIETTKLDLVTYRVTTKGCTRIKHDRAQYGRKRA